MKRLLIIVAFTSFFNVYKAFAQDSDRSLYFAFKGDSSLEENNFQMALSFYKKALTFDKLHFSHLYSLAISYDGISQPDSAYHYLSHAINEGFTSYDWLLWGGDFNNLRAEPEWDLLIKKMKLNYFKSISSERFDQKLFEDLLELAILDQKPRNLLQNHPSSFTNTDSIYRVIAINDISNASSLKKIITSYGWPSKELVGEKGVYYAWLIVQHSDQDPRFQEFCLKQIKNAAKKGEADWEFYMFLVDRIRVNKGLKQLYGTQYKSDGSPWPIKNPENLDKRKSKLLGNDKKK